MKLPDIRKYANEVNSLINQRDRAQQAVEEITALIRAASDGKEHQTQLQLEKQRASFQKNVETLEKALLTATKARDAEAARQLQVDLSLRIDAAMEAYVQWRKMVNEFEYAVDQGGFAPEPEPGQPPTGFTRSMAELELDKAKANCENRVAFAGKIIPERSVVLL